MCSGFTKGSTLNSTKAKLDSDEPVRMLFNFFLTVPSTFITTDTLIIQVFLVNNQSSVLTNTSSISEKTHKLLW